MFIAPAEIVARQKRLFCAAKGSIRAFGHRVISHDGRTLPAQRLGPAAHRSPGALNGSQPFENGGDLPFSRTLEPAEERLTPQRNFQRDRNRRSRA